MFLWLSPFEITQIEEVMMELEALIGADAKNSPFEIFIILLLVFQ